MNERVLIFGGLAIFLLLVLFPFWPDSERHANQPPALAINTVKEQCVAPTEFMRANHMQLLDQWRDDVVRRGERVHITTDGRTFEKSLTHTCLNCHENREMFCEQCHGTLNVQTYCWECHVTPMEVQ